MNNNDSERLMNAITFVWDAFKESVTSAMEQINAFTANHPKVRRVMRKMNAREKKRHDIETRQAARAYILVNRAPTLIHNGRKP